MFYCETCRVNNQWTRGIRGHPTSIGNCEMCGVASDCYDVPSHALDMDGDEQDFVPECTSCGGTGRAADASFCGDCNGWGSGAYAEQACGVNLCLRPAMPDRKLCENHAFPAARPKEATGRRAAIAATKKKIAAEAKVSDKSLEE